jgi:hypothetical protein
VSSFTKLAKLEDPLPEHRLMLQGEVALRQIAWTFKRQKKKHKSLLFLSFFKEKQIR